MTEIDDLDDAIRSTTEAILVLQDSLKVLERTRRKMLGIRDPRGRKRRVMAG